MPHRNRNSHCVMQAWRWLKHKRRLLRHQSFRIPTTFRAPDSSDDSSWSAKKTLTISSRQLVSLFFFCLALPHMRGNDRYCLLMTDRCEWIETGNHEDIDPRLWLLLRPRNRLLDCHHEPSSRRKGQHIPHGRRERVYHDRRPKNEGLKALLE